MSKILLIATVLLTLAGCGRAQTSALQLPGETIRSGLEVPPGANERPVQIATAR